MPGESEKNCKLFIGGISFNTTDEVLAEFYGRWGSLADWKAMRDATGRPRGFGFVTYEDPACLEAAMAARPHVIDGKTVDPKRAIPRDMGAETSQGSVKRVYVGGSKNLDQDSLREYFQGFGTVEQVEIPLDKETGNPRGFAFVTFDDYDAVDKAVLQGSQHHIQGSSVTVKKALEKGALGGFPARGGSQAGRDRGARMGRSRGAERGPFGGRGGYSQPYQSGYAEQGWRGSGGGGGGGGYGGGYGTGYGYGPAWGAPPTGPGSWGPDGSWNGAPTAPTPPQVPPQGNWGPAGAWNAAPPNPPASAYPNNWTKTPHQ